MLLMAAPAAIFSFTDLIRYSCGQAHSQTSSVICNKSDLSPDSVNFSSDQKGGIAMGGPGGFGGAFGGNFAFILFLILILLFFGDP